MEGWRDGKVGGGAEATAGQTNKSEGRSDVMGGVAVGGGVNRVGQRQEETTPLIGKKEELTSVIMYCAFRPFNQNIFSVQLPAVSVSSPRSVRPWWRSVGGFLPVCVRLRTWSFK